MKTEKEQVLDLIDEEVQNMDAAAQRARDQIRSGDLDQGQKDLRLDRIKRLSDRAEHFRSLKVLINDRIA